MPKETIHSDHLPLALEVAWGAGGHYVQVSIPNGDDLPPPSGSSTWCATFSDRAKINQMISVLRRARDNAFGRDE